MALINDRQLVKLRRQAGRPALHVALSHDRYTDLCSALFPRLLLPPHGHGQGLPRVRLPPEQDRQAHDLLLLLAGLPDLQRNDGTFKTELLL